MDLNIRLEAELIDMANQMQPSLGREVQYHRGVEELPVLTAVPDLPIFPKSVKLPEGDSPTSTTTRAKPSRTVGPLRKIKWVVVDRGGKAQSEFQDAVVPEDIALIQLWGEQVLPKGTAVAPPTIAWGRHFRSGHEIGSGTVSSIEDGDLVQVGLPEAKSGIGIIKKGKVKIEYTLGTSPQLYEIKVKASNTIGYLYEIQYRFPRTSSCPPIRRDSSKGWGLAPSCYTEV
jgi:hypothetical protein